MKVRGPKPWMKDINKISGIGAATIAIVFLLAWLINGKRPNDAIIIIMFLGFIEGRIFRAFGR